MDTQIAQNAINILKKLYDNIEKYEVKVQKNSWQPLKYTGREDFKFIIHYKYNNKYFRLCITSTSEIAFDCDTSQICTNVDDLYLFETLCLAQKLYDKSKDYTLNLMTEFANN